MTPRRFFRGLALPDVQESSDQIWRLKSMSKIRNDKGRGSGLMLIIILVVALIVAYLEVQQMKSLGVGGTTQQEQVQEQDPVDAAQDAVDALNERIEEAGQDAAE